MLVVVLQQRDDTFVFLLIQFFMRATSLEQITSDYYYIMEQKGIALETLERKEQVQSMSAKKKKEEKQL